MRSWIKQLDNGQRFYLFAVLILLVTVSAYGLRSHAPNSVAARTATTTVPLTTTTKPVPSTTTSTIHSYISAAQSSNFVGDVKTVRVHIAYTFTDSAGTEFLDQYTDYTSGFVVAIYSSDLSNFTVDPASALQGDTLDVTGQIAQYNGYFEILDPTSIQVVS